MMGDRTCLQSQILKAKIYRSHQPDASFQREREKTFLKEGKLADAMAAVDHLPSAPSGGREESPGGPSDNAIDLEETEALRETIAHHRARLSDVGRSAGHASCSSAGASSVSCSEVRKGEDEPS